MVRLIKYIGIIFFTALFYLQKIEAMNLLFSNVKNTVIHFNEKIRRQYIVKDSTLHLKLVKTIKGDFKDFEIDNLGNVFLISTSNQLKKLDNKYDSIAIFNNSKKYGDIFSIDVSNPLRVLVYYKDFATILMLDRQLNGKNVIDLRQHNIFQVSAIAQSFDNRIWLFDEEDNMLKKIDEYGKVLLKTPDFRILFDGTPNYVPNKIIDMNGLLYLYHPKGGWKLFDYYGGFKTQYAFLNWQDVSVEDGFLQGHNQSTFFIERPKDLQSVTFKTNIDLNRARKVMVRQDTYYLLTQIGFEIYTSL